MEQEKYTDDTILNHQLSTSMEDHGLTSKEEIITFCFNSMTLAGSNILAQTHDFVFKGMLDPKDEFNITEPSFEEVEEDLDDIVHYLFCVLNILMIDAPRYSELMEAKEGLPILRRTDKILGNMALMQSVADLYLIVWEELEGGNIRTIQKDEEDLTGDVSGINEGLETTIYGLSGDILTSVEVMCQHWGKSIRDLLS